MVSEKLGNFAAAGGGLIIFLVTVILLGFMTDEYNKGKKFEALKAAYDLLKINNKALEIPPSQPIQSLDDRCKYCKLPFINENNTYSDCAKSEYGDTYWCPTEVDGNGVFVKGYWISCPQTKCSGCKESKLIFLKDLKTLYFRFL